MMPVLDCVVTVIEGKGVKRPSSREGNNIFREWRINVQPLLHSRRGTPVERIRYENQP
jgi:hypothetical protein